MKHPTKVIESIKTSRECYSLLDVLLSICELFEANVHMIKIYPYHYQKWLIALGNDQLMVTLVLIRGAPGSGKKQYAQNEYPTFKHFSTDDFFIKGGNYHWESNKTRVAHEWCFDKVMKSIEDGNNTVVCNTFISKIDVMKYVDAAKEKNVNFRIIRMTSCFKSNHEVPGIKVESMIAMLSVNKIHCEYVISGDFQPFPTYPYILKNQDHIPHNTLTSLEKDYWITFEDQIKIRDGILKAKFENNDKCSYSDHFNYLASILYTMIPPLRDEWHNVEIVDTYFNNCTNKNANYFLVNRTEKILILGEGIDDFNPSITIDMNFSRNSEILNLDLVWNILERSMMLLPRKYVFCDKSNHQKPMSKSAFSDMLNNIYSDNNPKGRKTSITMLRRAYVSNLDMNAMDSFEIEDIAKRMRVKDMVTMLAYRVLG
jgi:NEDD4-binding protein 2